jgi:hypothetical protein
LLVLAAGFFALEEAFLDEAIFFELLLLLWAILPDVLVMVVFAVVVLPLVETVVVALVVPDLVVTVFDDGVFDGVFEAASAGVAIIASAATELISFFI